MPGIGPATLARFFDDVVLRLDPATGLTEEKVYDVAGSADDPPADRILPRCDRNELRRLRALAYVAGGPADGGDTPGDERAVDPVTDGCDRGSVRFCALTGRGVKKLAGLIKPGDTVVVPEK